MPTEAEMKAVLQKYLDAWNAGDAEAVIALFADDAVVHDPHGSEPKVGKDAFGEFFRNGAKGGLRLTLDAPVRGSQGDSAAMAFTVIAGAMTIRVIDVMRFAPDGKIVEMHGYWGQTDLET
ncbi:MAG: SgcJ/EcaC family oxidoreductase [Mycobacteriaceae bacterium]|nr:SgcJ/EcaC family oxidoreductase [Mycobacteriaceae bacterium]